MFSADQQGGGHRWPLVRVSVGGKTRVVIVRSSFLPLTSHWVGRSVVCPGSECELCQVLPTRSLWYLPVLCDGRPRILELSSLSSSHLEQHCKLLYGGMHTGLEVELSRGGRRSPVRSEVIGRIETATEVGLMEFAPKVMALYHLPGPNPDEGFREYEGRLQLMALRRSKVERERWEAGAKKSVAGQETL